MERKRTISVSARCLIAASLVLGALLSLLIVPERAYGATVKKIEGERMNLPSGKGKVFRDRRASGGRGLVIYRPATAKKRLRTPALARIDVRAKGRLCNGAPTMVVFVDGKRVKTARVRAKGWRNYRTHVSIPKGVHRISVGFRQDYRKPGRCNRDLKIDVVKLMPKPTTNLVAQPVAPSPGTGVGTEPATKSTCKNSLQTLLDAAAPGSTVVTPGGCVYREMVTVNKPLTLKAGEGAEIRGSDVWSEWTKSGSYWVKGMLPEFSSGGYCKTGTSRCKWPEQVFFDGKPLLQVASEPRSGQFAVDGSRRVMLADDPTGHTVEVSTRRHWVIGRSDNVTVEGFTMKHAANGAQMGALKNDRHNNWTVRNNDLSYAHGYNLTLGAANRLRAVGNDIHHAGQLGIGGARADLEVRGNKIHHNNTEDFDPGWEAGGMKNARMIRLVADNNEVYSNDRVGFWCDISCDNVTYSNNRVHHNKKAGIFYEISDNAKIFGNEVWKNGWESPGVGFGEAGILVSSSRNVEVYDNVVAWNNDGITVVNDDRKQGDGVQYDRVTDVKVHHNYLLGKDYPGNSIHMTLAWVKAYSGGNIYNTAAGNGGYDNRYWYPESESYPYRYKWNGSFKKLGDFNGTLGEERGRYLSNSEKDRLMADRDVPAVP